MRNQVVQLTVPKTRKAALNQAAYIQNQIKGLEQKEVNFMSQKNQIQDKMERLKSQLQSLEKQISNCNIAKDNWKEELEKLKVAHQLTEAEILETQSALLRLQISKLESEAGIQRTGRNLDS